MSAVGWRVAHLCEFRASVFSNGVGRPRARASERARCRVWCDWNVLDGKELPTRLRFTVHVHTVLYILYRQFKFSKLNFQKNLLVY